MNDFVLHSASRGRVRPARGGGLVALQLQKPRKQQGSPLGDDGNEEMSRA